MAKPLTDVCGRRSPLGGFEQMPMKYSEAQKKHDQWDMEQKEFTLQWRPDVDQQLSEVLALTGYLIDEASATKQVTISIARTHNEGLRRNQVHTKKYPTDKPFTVGSKAARRIMNHEVYSYLFEEVDDGAVQVPQASQNLLLKPGQYDFIEKLAKKQEETDAKLAALAATNAALAAENAALKNIVGAAPSPAPSGDSDEDDTTTTDKTPPAAAAPGGSPPKPGKKAQAASSSPPTTPPPATTQGG